MSEGLGWQCIMGIKKEATYGTAVACDKVLPFITEGIGEDIGFSKDESIGLGVAGANSYLRGTKEYNGDLVCNGRYGDTDYLLAAGMGAVGTPAQVDTSDFYTNDYTLNSRVNTSWTMAIDKSVAVHEYAGCKVDKIVIAGTPGGPCTITYTLSARSMVNDSSTNTSGTLGALTPLNAPVIMFEDSCNLVASTGYVRIGDCSDALASGDELEISSFELTLENNLRTGKFANCGIIDEPLREALRTVTLKVGMVKYTSDQYRTWLLANTSLQADILFYDQVAGEDEPYKFQIKVGNMQVTEYPTPVEGQGVIEPTVTFGCSRADEANPTWATMTEEFEIAVQNKLDASPLA